MEGRGLPLTTLEITDDEDIVVFNEELVKLHMTCAECKLNVGYVYSDKDTYSKTIGWYFVCEKCKP